MRDKKKITEIDKYTDSSREWNKNKNEKRSEGAEHDVKNFNEDINGN